MKNFIVVDTEGQEILSEIAIINNCGQLIYEAFNLSHPNNAGVTLKTRSLRDILLDFFQLAQGQIIVCHYANHDIQVLQQSCQQVNVRWKRSLQFQCTYELAKKYLPQSRSYSLEYLSKKFNLKVHHHYFNPRQAHRALYDAEFTYQLYLKMMDLPLQQSLKDKPNPFSSSKVDHPFQDHPDLKQIFQSEFELLKSALNDIRFDRNHQSQGAVIIGEPGSGKTHLIMRLAKELLQVNRLLFIGQPNNPDSVLYHIYTRILKSFVETVPGNGYTQLENLLARSFVNIISTTPPENLTRNDQVILTLVARNPLNLYNLASEGTDRKRMLWLHIERRTREWWADKYGLSGFSVQIIKGIIKFCSYIDPRKKELATRWLAAHDLEPADVESIGLENWNEDLSKEDFSLEAISVFSKLSLLDEPLIIVFDQLEGLGLDHNRHLLERFGEAVKEIFTYVPNSLIILNLFPDRWQQFQSFFDGSVIDRISQHRIFLNRPDNDRMQQVLQLKARLVGVDLHQLFTSPEVEQILNQISIRSVLNRAADYYRYKIRGIPLPPGSPSLLPNPPLNSVEQRLDRLEQSIQQFHQVMQTLATAFGAIALPEPAVPPLPEPEPNPELPILPSEQQQVLDYLQLQRPLLEEEYDRLQIITDSDDIGKLMTIAEAFRLMQDFEIDCLRLGRRKLPEHRLFQSVHLPSCNVVVGFLYADGSRFTNLLKNYNELVVAHREIEFFLWRDVRESEITGKVGLEEIEKLNNTPNGWFRSMEQDDRIEFELLYKLITDIQNRDLEVELVPALETVVAELKDNWLVQLLHKLG